MVDEVSFVNILLQCVFCDLSYLILLAYNWEFEVDKYILIFHNDALYILEK